VTPPWTSEGWSIVLNGEVTQGKCSGDVQAGHRTALGVAGDDPGKLVEV
jgi:hypothetical protein